MGVRFHSGSQIGSRAASKEETTHAEQQPRLPQGGRLQRAGADLPGERDELPRLRQPAAAPDGYDPYAAGRTPVRTGPSTAAR